MGVIQKVLNIAHLSVICWNLYKTYHCQGRIVRGGSGAGSLGGAQQLTGGGVVAKKFP